MDIRKNIMRIFWVLFLWFIFNSIGNIAFVFVWASITGSWGGGWGAFAKMAEAYNNWQSLIKIVSFVSAAVLVFLRSQKDTLPITFTATIRALGGGWLVGSAIDESDKRALVINPNHLTLVKIAKMSKEGVSATVIIDEIQNTHSIYQLNSEIINYLRKNKVSDTVIGQMRGIK